MFLVLSTSVWYFPSSETFSGSQSIYNKINNKSPYFTIFLSLKSSLGLLLTLSSIHKIASDPFSCVWEIVAEPISHHGNQKTTLSFSWIPYQLGLGTQI